MVSHKNRKNLEVLDLVEFWWKKKKKISFNFYVNFLGPFFHEKSFSPKMFFVKNFTKLIFFFSQQTSTHYNYTPSETNHEVCIIYLKGKLTKNQILDWISLYIVEFTKIFWKKFGMFFLKLVFCSHRM